MPARKPATSQIASSQLDTMLEKIRTARNFDFRHYKRATLFRRLERRMQERECKSFDEYLALLERDPAEYDQLISRMLIKVTSFFRDVETWRTLREKVIPGLLRNRRPTDEVRVWCAGCATGEEAYSVAMLLHEAIGRVGGPQIKVFGTDGDDGAVAYARRGIYTADQVKNVPKELMKRYFQPMAEGFGINKELRRGVVFGVNNLTTDAPISRLDLILCRNVFIYLDQTLQRRVLARFHYALRRDGVLILGRSELIPFASKIFEPVDLQRRIYRKDPRRDIPLGPQDRLPGADRDVLTLPLTDDDDARHPPLAQLSRDAVNSMTVPVVAVSSDGIVLLWNNAAARMWGRSEQEVIGRKLNSLALSGLAGDAVAEKSALVREGRSDREVVDTSASSNGKPVQMAARIEIAALREGPRGGYGLIYTVYDVTSLRQLEAEHRRVNEELRAANDKLRSSNDELQSFNEELETTNEELQSANEELQTTNEELQSTNEELETTNEELQSTNAELDATNRELAHRTEEMNVLAFYQRSTVRAVSCAIVLLDARGRITTWNLAAERLFGILEREALGQLLWTMDVPALKKPVLAAMRKAFASRKSLRMSDLSYATPMGGVGTANLSAISLTDGGSDLGGLVIVEDTTRMTTLAEEVKRLKAQPGQKQAAKKTGTKRSEKR